jgi:hypothetical protein
LLSWLNGFGSTEPSLVALGLAVTVGDLPVNMAMPRLARPSLKTEILRQLIFLEPQQDLTFKIGFMMFYAFYAILIYLDSFWFNPNCFA